MTHNNTLYFEDIKYTTWWLTAIWCLYLSLSIVSHSLAIKFKTKKFTVSKKKRFLQFERIKDKIMIHLFILTFVLTVTETVVYWIWLIDHENNVYNYVSITQYIQNCAFLLFLVVFEHFTLHCCYVWGFNLFQLTNGIYITIKNQVSGLTYRAGNFLGSKNRYEATFFLYSKVCTRICRMVPLVRRQYAGQKVLD